MRRKPTDVWQGTLALMILKTLDTMGAMHGYGIARRIEQTSGERLSINYGTLYTALLTLEQEGFVAGEWGASDANRRARYYGLTRAGTKLVKEGVITSVFGIGAGLALALALVQVLRRSGMLYQVSAVDPVVFALAPLILIAATAAASYIPARRALRIDPAEALRSEQPADPGSRRRQRHARPCVS